jgi:hypothetical protein
MKRKIVESDDENENDNKVMKVDYHWLDVRDVNKMSEKERLQNIQIAKNERKEAKKVKKITLVDSDDDSVISSPSNLNLHSNHDSFLVDTPDDKHHHHHQKKKNEMKQQKKSSKVVKKAAAVVDVSDEDGEDEMDDDDDDDDDENDYEEMNQSEIEEKTREIVSECESLTSDLRTCLKLHHQDQDNAQDCVSLLDIQAMDHQSYPIILQHHLEEICPGLQLKGYQLVGLNWLRLLHDNQINGVLADDMGKLSFNPKALSHLIFY